jgi:ribosome-binding protein aMBF1 (putative translation factor)
MSHRMPICKGCGEEVDELASVKVDGKTKKLCEDCAEAAEATDAVARESESVVQNMMGFKGRR